MFTALFLIPLFAGLGLEYSVFRFPKRRFWRYLPPLAAGIVTVLVVLARYHGWSDEGEKAPLSTLLFVPGIPAFAVLAGMFLGWRVWKYLWMPRIIKDRKKP